MQQVKFINKSVVKNVQITKKAHQSFLKSLNDPSGAKNEMALWYRMFMWKKAFFSIVLFLWLVNLMYKVVYKLAAKLNMVCSAQS